MSIVTPLRRTAIIVRDMDRSLQFYGEVLGLNVWVQGRAGADNPAFFTLLGAPPCTLRYVILQSEDVEWGMVGLFELSEPPPADDTHHAIDRANRGEACLVFHTPDVRSIHRGALAMGLTVLCPPTRLVLKAHGLESLEMTLRDPNGVLLNFIQNLRGGIGPANRFPGIVREAVARKSRKTTRKAPGKRVKNAEGITRKSSAVKNDPEVAVKPRSGASRRRRSG
jgi:catechol 2,3-dioxygenase-like lactoylglutathione lyase family enzyme